MHGRAMENLTYLLRSHTSKVIIVLYDKYSKMFGLSKTLSEFPLNYHYLG
jgi:hypothetical protein